MNKKQELKCGVRIMKIFNEFKEREKEITDLIPNRYDILTNNFTGDEFVYLEHHKLMKKLLNIKIKMYQNLIKKILNLLLKKIKKED